MYLINAPLRLKWFYAEFKGPLLIKTFSPYTILTSHAAHSFGLLLFLMWRLNFDAKGRQKCVRANNINRKLQASPKPWTMIYLQHMHLFRDTYTAPLTNYGRYNDDGKIWNAVSILNLKNITFLQKWNHTKRVFIITFPICFILFNII